MEIRSVILISALLAGALPGQPRVIKTCVLDPRRVYTIAVGTEVPTTCVFPGPVGAMATAGVAEDAKVEPPVLISHGQGEAFFTVRALKPGAKAALNVFLGSEVYVLDLVASDSPDRLVRFAEAGEQGASAGRCRELVRQAQELALIGAAGSGSQVARFSPHSTTLHAGFRAELQEVFRFDPDGVLIGQVKLENPGATAIHIAPEGIAVRLGREIFPAVHAEGATGVPSGGSAIVWFAVRAPLPAEAPISVLVPTRR
jgi:hypothetical protein